jgi:transposase
MWTPTTRQQHSRPVTRYQTDLTDAEWHVIAPHLPKPCATGRPREWPMREIVNGIFYVMRAGCAWRLLPSDLPPWETSTAGSPLGATKGALNGSTTHW